MRRHARPNDAGSPSILPVIDAVPEALPPVASKHLLAAWDLASDAARAGTQGPLRALRFSSATGQSTRTALLTDIDAACWAGAIGRVMDFGTRYGLSVCLRLLALVHLLGRQDWAARLALVHAEGIRLDPALLRAAAEAELTKDAQFDEQDLLNRLQKRAEPGAQPGA